MCVFFNFVIAIVNVFALVPNDSKFGAVKKIFHLKGPVEKGRKWWFEVKIEIAPI